MSFDTVNMKRTENSNKKIQNFVTAIFFKILNISTVYTVSPKKRD